MSPVDNINETPDESDHHPLPSVAEEDRAIPSRTNAVERAAVKRTRDCHFVDEGDNRVEEEPRMHRPQQSIVWGGA